MRKGETMLVQFYIILCYFGTGDTKVYWMKKILGLALCGMMALNAMAQRSMITRSSIDHRARIVGELPRDPAKVEAERFARQYGIPEREIDDQGRIKRLLDNDRNILEEYIYYINGY